MSLPIIFIESPDGDTVGQVLFVGDHYIPRLGDFVRRNMNLYKVAHVEWVYPEKGGPPVKVEVLLQPVT